MHYTHMSDHFVLQAMSCQVKSLSKVTQILTQHVHFLLAQNVHCTQALERLSDDKALEQQAKVLRDLPVDQALLDRVVAEHL